MEWKRLDGAIILLAVVLSLLPLVPLLFGSDSKHAEVRIEQHGEVLYTGSLDKDCIFTTPDGKNTVRIENGEVRMIEADCSDGLCLAAGKATSLRPIVCLPNEVTVTLIAKEEVGYDALTQ